MGDSSLQLHTAFHYHPPIVLIWLKHCWKGYKIASHPIHLIRAFSDFKAFLYILIGAASDFKAFLYILIGTANQNI